MSYLLKALFCILGIMALLANKDVEIVLSCFAVSALFDIADKLWRKNK